MYIFEHTWEERLELPWRVRTDSLVEAIEVSMGLGKKQSGEEGGWYRDIFATLLNKKCFAFVNHKLCIYWYIIDN